MNATRQLEQYLNTFNQRLRRLTLLQGLAFSSLVLLLIAVTGAWLARESGQSPATVNIARLLLVATVGTALYFTVYRPLQRLRSRLGEQVERRSPGFAGRVRTWLDLREDRNPMADLLAEDALQISRHHPVNVQVPRREFSLAGAATALSLLVLLYLLVAGPGLINYSLRNLFAGWAVGDVLPPQLIAVTPGDQSVRRGANLRISSQMQGFSPDRATLHVRSSNDGWQEVPMVRGPEGFEFTFFSVQEPLEYYVSSTGMRSPGFDIQVVDLPDIEQISLTYHFPEWSQREPETVERGGDIRALEETRIELNVTTSAPLPEGGRLVLNRVSQPLQTDGKLSQAEFTVNEEGDYYIAAMVGNDEVRLSDDYFIRITPDGKPRIEFTKPGRDWNASNIEEVLTRVTASDDYGLEQVTIKYAINGGEWHSIELHDGTQGRELNAEYLFMLEDMRTPASRVRGPLEEARPPEMVPLKPGDLIAYYAEAADRSNVERTDMYFIQVQPFNRRYEQSQLSGGGGGMGGGNQEEISQRQRQIIVSTWNLIREAEDSEEEGPVRVNASLLSDLQRTLADQATTLAERTRARQLTRDADIQEFIESMELAAEAMDPAATYLGDVALEEAIQPAQEALQYLLRAESIFNDITLSQQQGGSGGGGQAQRDLAEMFELELDMEKNQYETGSRATPRSEQQQAEDLMQQLDELARRQEQLANNMRNQNRLSEAQRWQQEMLRRDAERLREELEQLERQQSPQPGSQQAQQGQQPGQTGEQSAEAQPGQGGEHGGSQGGAEGSEGSQGQGQGEQIARSELQRRLDSAIRAMEDSSRAMQGEPSQEELQRAAEEARNQLQGARDQVAQQRQDSMRGAFEGLAEQSERMAREQRRMQQQLQDAMRRAVEERESGENPDSRGMTLAEEWQLAREKQRLAADIQRLQQDMLSAVQQYGEQAPDAKDEVQGANTQLVESELQQAVSDAALYIDNGYGLYIAGNESSVSRVMDNIADRLQRARQVASADGEQRDNERQRALAQAQDLRGQMQEQLQRGGTGQRSEEQSDQPGTPGQTGSSPSSPSGQQAQTGESQRGSGGWGGGAWNEGPDSGNQPLRLPENFYDNLDQLTDSAREAAPALNLGREQLAAMYELIRELEYTRANRNDAILAEEYASMLTLIEQLEMNLQGDRQRSRGSNVRTLSREEIPEAYQDSVADYYRRLSEE